MSSNWIHAKEYSINSILLMDRWILRHLIGFCDNPFYEDTQYRRYLGIILAYHPIIRWYYETKCPESVERVDALARNAPAFLFPGDVREAEKRFLDTVDTFIVYLYPEVMNTKLLLYTRLGSSKPTIHY